MTFQRYNKFLVFKWDDINKYLRKADLRELEDFCNRIEEGRKSDGKNPRNSYVVVNENEPYAEDVWDLIEMHEAVAQIQDRVNADPELKEFFERWVL